MNNAELSGEDDVPMTQSLDASENLETAASLLTAETRIFLLLQTLESMSQSAWVWKALEQILDRKTQSGLWYLRFSSPKVRALILFNSPTNFYLNEGCATGTLKRAQRLPSEVSLKRRVPESKLELESRF
ncbi:hypothetical protein RRG08_044336 [Elysia crispata]|uniref:Uncharacterized protein n=1 Tax=Elysia crispata TaxID=231223 RepID=A0AAE1AAX5_9GAST|nr:hypothetical protein RRG08_044336 [Elysia crispata]